MEELRLVKEQSLSVSGIYKYNRAYFLHKNFNARIVS